MVRQILSFSRQNVPKQEAVDLARVVNEAVKLLRAGLRANIALETDCNGELPAVLADSTQIHQIVMNLGTNAADAIGDKQGLLKIRLETVEASAMLASSVPGLRGRHVRLSVTENGCGMDERTRRQIFEPFFTTKPTGQGTGLGLSVVHSIVQQHGGTITVQSAPGAGTTFEIYLPVAARNSVDEKSVAAEQVSLGHGEHILYVDDEEPLVLLLTRMLERLGYQVSGCSEPAKALELFRSSPNSFDAVVTDLSMPGMSGTDFAQEVRRIRPSAPILITSGYIRPQDNEIVRKMGLPDILLKPDTIEQLAKILNNVLSEHKKSAAEINVPDNGPQGRAAVAGRL